MEQLRPSNIQLCKYDTTGERKRFVGDGKKYAGKGKDQVKSSLKYGCLGVVIHSQSDIRSCNICINEVTYHRLQASLLLILIVKPIEAFSLAQINSFLSEYILSVGVVSCSWLTTTYPPSCFLTPTPLSRIQGENTMEKLMG